MTFTSSNVRLCPLLSPSETKSKVPTKRSSGRTAVLSPVEQQKDTMSKSCIYKTGLLIFTFQAITGCGLVKLVFSPSYPNSYPNKFEWSYEGIALNIKNADLCYKISPLPFTEVMFGVPGLKTSYKRSSCFFRVAEQTMNPDLCKNVISRNPYWGPDGSKLSKEECEIITKSKPSAHDSGGNIDYELIMRILGYYDNNSEPNIPETPNEPYRKGNLISKMFRNLYLEELPKLEFREKLLTLPDFSSSDEAAIIQIHILAPQCTANDYVNPLCKRINCGLIRDHYDCIPPK
jgi:hypothetical protein